MGLNLFISSNTNKLSKQLCTNSKKHSDNPFDKQIIITQNEGINQWLKIQFAKENGVFSNFDFIKPNNFVNNVFWLAEITSQDEYNTEKIRWYIYKILSTDSLLEKHGVLKSFLEDDELKIIQLATKIADLFDQYLIYRSDYINLWNNHEQIVTTRKDLQAHADWQKDIWNELKGNFTFEDKVGLAQHLQKAFNQEAFIHKLKSRYDRISIFGLSILTPFHLDVFSKVSEHIEVDFYLFNPAPNEYWYDETGKKSITKIERYTKKSADELFLKSGNPLLSNWGKTGKDLFNQLYDANEELEVTNLDSDYSRSEGNLLSKLQSEIKETVVDEDDLFHDELIEDSSILINSCFSPIREIEELLLYVNDLVSKGAQLDEVLVVVNDIELYSPYIKSIFDNSSIPFNIAGAKFSNQESISKALTEFLSFNYEDINNIKLVSLLRHDLIKSKYQISDLEFIEKLISDLNFRFGIEGSKEDSSDLVSFKSAVEKLILGYSTAHQQINNSIYPLRDYSDSDYLEVFKFVGFVNDLILYLKNRPNSASLEDWSVFFQEEIIDRFFNISDDYLEERIVINEHLRILQDLSNELDSIKFETVRRAFLDSLVNNIKSSQFISGKLTFTSLIPLRGVPYKHIAILGMNQSDFPRTETPISYDLSLLDRRRGDRNVKESDKYLFLEYLFAAQSSLYLSYVGRDQKDLSDKPASIIIDEFEDYILSNSEKHKSFIKKSSLTSTYSLYGRNTKLNTGYIDVESKDSVIDYKNLVKFYKDPVKYFAENRIGVYYDFDRHNDLEPYEKFDIESPLLKFQIRDYINNTEEIDVKWLQSIGVIPLSQKGEFDYDSLAKEVTEFHDRIVELNDLRQEAIQLEVKGSILETTINLNKGLIIDWSYSSKEKLTTNIINAVFDFLIARSVGLDYNLKFYNLNVHKPTEISHDLISTEQATKELEGLIDTFNEGQIKPLLYSPVLAKKAWNQYFLSLIDGKPYKFLSKSLTMKKEISFDEFDPLKQEQIDKTLFPFLKKK